MKRNLLLLLCSFFFVISNVVAQGKDKPVHEHELGIGAGLHTRGFNVVVNYCKITSDKYSFLGQLEFTELKNPKEKRLSNESLSIGRNSKGSYIYGKQNNFYTFRAGAGQRIYLSEKSKKSIISMAFAYSGGFSMGMLKPYYLDLIYRTDNEGISIRSERYTEVNRYKFLDPVDIDGATGSSVGWDDLSVLPGAYGKAALIFDWGPKDDIVKILEVGMAADLFFKNVPIMIDQPNSPLFLNLYLNFYFGKRW